LKRNIGNLSAIQEKSGYLLRQRGNERFVGHSEVTRCGLAVAVGLSEEWAERVSFRTRKWALTGSRLSPTGWGCQNP